MPNSENRRSNYQTIAKDKDKHVTYDCFVEGKIQWSPGKWMSTEHCNDENKIMTWVDFQQRTKIKAADWNSKWEHSEIRVIDPQLNIHWNPNCQFAIVWW